jgi:hypothetical protein
MEQAPGSKFRCQLELKRRSDDQPVHRVFAEGRPATPTPTDGVWVVS